MYNPIKEPIQYPNNLSTSYTIIPLNLLATEMFTKSASIQMKTYAW